MSPVELEPLPVEVAEALELERRRPDLSPDSHRLLCERINLALAATEIPMEPTGEVLPSPSPSLRPLVTSKMGLALFAAGAIAGGVAGAGLHAALSSPQEPLPAVAPVEVSSPATPQEVRQEDAPAQPKPPSRKVPTASQAAPQPPGAATVADPTLGKELALLELARTALARGQAGEALLALERHEREFPGGRLAEERESVAIQALLALGREADARRRPDNFRRRYPESMLRPLIDTLVPPSAERQIAPPRP